MINNLLLISGVDIPFPQARLTIHQPTIKEISYIGEENFFLGCEILNYSQPEKDKKRLKNKTNFDIIMSILKSKDPSVLKSKVSAMMVLSLMFPDYQISVDEKSIVLVKEQEKFFLNNENQILFQEILQKMYRLTNTKAEYKPQGDMAARISEQIAKGKQKVAALKAGNNKKEIKVLEQYLSILSVGLPEDINILTQYTVYQLFEVYNRFMKKINYDAYFSMKMAGVKTTNGQEIEEVSHWVEDKDNN